MKRFPSWIKKRLILSDRAGQIENLISELDLYTVCKSACCPNKSECFSQKRVTFMILGNICTRNCKFCAVKKGQPLPVADCEPKRLSEAVEKLALNHVVITSVTRDDLEDGGSSQFNEAAYQIRNKRPRAVIEVLTPDFKGKEDLIDKVLDAPIDIFSHNLETVPRLHTRVRPQADYQRSLKVLRRTSRRADITTKSGMMAGLGETKDEVFALMHDLRNVGCEILVIGQYLQPTKNQLDVYEFIHPDIFDLYKEKALSLGFKDVLSGPFARTSYMEESNHGQSNIA